MIKSEIIADSVNLHGNRLTTFILEYPRFVHSEFMTHRMFSKNAASSRAIPFEKFVQQIKDNPAMPEYWGKNQSGMQAAEELDDISAIYSEGDISIGLYSTSIPISYTAKEYAKIKWLDARDKAIEQATLLNQLGLHKQIVNRILEPWFHIRVICSATEYENFFALRAHKDAQPEIQVLAEMMLENYNNSTPKKLKAGEWHIPFGDEMDEFRVKEVAASVNPPPDVLDYAIEIVKKKVAVARCARVSYHNYEGKDDYFADVKLCDRLFGTIPKHLSPAEHVAEAMDNNDFIGNFRGFKQYRKHFLDENLSDNRVTKSL